MADWMSGKMGFEISMDKETQERVDGAMVVIESVVGLGHAIVTIARDAMKLYQDELQADDDEVSAFQAPIGGRVQGGILMSDAPIWPQAAPSDPGMVKVMVPSKWIPELDAWLRRKANSADS